MPSVLCWNTLKNQPKSVSDTSCSTLSWFLQRTIMLHHNIAFLLTLLSLPYCNASSAGEHQRPWMGLSLLFALWLTDLGVALQSFSSASTCCVFSLGRLFICARYAEEIRPVSELSKGHCFRGGRFLMTVAQAFHHDQSYIKIALWKDTQMDGMSRFDRFCLCRGSPNSQADFQAF